MRRLPILITLALCACLMACTATAAASAGVLSTSEYQQLEAAQTQISHLGPAARNFARFRRICTGLQPSTGLMRAERADCLAFGRFGFAGVTADTAANRCTARGASVSQMDHCMLPSFTAYRAGARSYYFADRHVDHVAQQRGFSSRCVAALGNTQRIVTDEGRLATDLGAFVAALRRADPAALQVAAKRVDDDARALRGGSGSLARCPHQ